MLVNTPTEHSPIGASSMYRWSICPASVRLSKGIPNKSSIFAEEGTKAHDIASRILLGETINEDLSEDMLNAVNLYVDFVNNESLDIKKSNGLKGEIYIEKRFDLSSLHEGLFGTADCVIYHKDDQLLQVIDYKHGIGIPVEVKNNYQLMYYALGAFFSLEDETRAITEIELIIVQPRAFHKDGPIRRWKLHAYTLNQFRWELMRFAQATTKKDAPLKTGEHCRFCPASPICPKKYEEAMIIAKNEFKPVETYAPIELKEALNIIPNLESWIKKVKEFALDEAESGRVPMGFKLVPKRPTRKWHNENEVSDFILSHLKLGKDDIYDLKIKSPTQVEKLLTKKEKELLANYIVSVSSGNNLVPENDKKQKITMIENEFNTLT